MKRFHIARPTGKQKHYSELLRRVRCWVCHSENYIQVCAIDIEGQLHR
jgi:hypothetical protein